MSKDIEFLAQDNHVWNVRPKPYPAIKNMPQWWKDVPVYAYNEKKLNLNPGPNVTVKRCVPTIDALGAGYYVPLWADLLVKQDNGIPSLNWNTMTPVAEAWSASSVSSFELKDGYSKIVFKNLHGWSIKTPPGWSCMFIHPIAYPNLPFEVISGIVDTDVFHGEINVPFIIKEGFEGIIERDTPMFQVIPFKREVWNSKFRVKDTLEHFFDVERLLSKINRSYASMIKDKKMYR
jgi:hypothetical protein